MLLLMKNFNLFDYFAKLKYLMFFDSFELHFPSSSSWSSMNNSMLWDFWMGMSVLVFFFVFFWLMVMLIPNNYLKKGIYKKYKEDDQMETVWTIMPLFLMILLFVPNLMVLRKLQEGHDSYLSPIEKMSGNSVNPFVKVKVKGFQWFWSWSTLFTKGEEKSGDVYPRSMSSDYSWNNQVVKSKMGCEKKYEALLKTNGTVLVQSPKSENSQGVILHLVGTSKDVLHSMGSDMFGTVDVCPGRQQAVTTYVPYGLYQGRCMELCGMGHSHMPISFKVD